MATAQAKAETWAIFVGFLRNNAKKCRLCQIPHNNHWFSLISSVVTEYIITTLYVNRSHTQLL